MNPRILPLTPASTSWLRFDRLMLLGRYDWGALPLAVFNIVKQLETELAWRKHAERTDPRRSADQSTAV
jgi:hypothetical protein